MDGSAGSQKKSGDLMTYLNNCTNPGLPASSVLLDVRQEETLFFSEATVINYLLFTVTHILIVKTSNPKYSMVLIHKILQFTYVNTSY